MNKKIRVPLYQWEISAIYWDCSVFTDFLPQISQIPQI
jgi:hypothetical protein